MTNEVGNDRYDSGFSICEGHDGSAGGEGRAGMFVEQANPQFPNGPSYHLFDLQMSFITQMEALCMLYMLVKVRVMKRVGYTTVLVHLSGRFTKIYPYFAYFEKKSL